MFKLSTSINKLHFTLLFVSSLHRSGSNNWNCLAKRYFRVFGRSFAIFICVTHTNIFYINLAANSCQTFIIYIKLIYSQQPKERWLPPTKGIMQVFRRVVPPLLDGEVGFLCFNFNMYLKHLRQDKISCVKDSFLAICKTLPWNAAQKFKIKKELSLVWRLRLWTYKVKLPCNLVNLFILVSPLEKMKG